jgi:hypothetical protein
MYFSWGVSVAISDILESGLWESEALTGTCIRISIYKERQYDDDDALVKFLKVVPMYLRGRNLTVCCAPELKPRCLRVRMGFRNMDDTDGGNALLSCSLLPQWVYD